MRVLFVTHNVPRFDGDPAGSFVLRLAVALQAAGARVEIIAPGAPGMAARDEREGVTIHRVRYAEDADMTLAYTGTMVEQVRSSWKARFALIGLMRALRRFTQHMGHDAERDGDAFSIVHTHWWFPTGLALWRGFARAPKGPGRILTMHGSDVRLAHQIAPARVLMRAVVNDHDVATAVSRWLADIVDQHVPGRRTHVAPMPVDVRHFHQPDIDARDGILFVGRLNAQKGIADLVQALAEPSLRHVTLNVVGDGPERENVAALARDAGVASRIHWHGALPHAQLLPLYQRARVVAMPSREEGLGLVAVEAQLCGTPVVAYASGGLTDVVRPDAGGTLVPEGDIVQFAAALAQLLDDPTRAAECGRAAHASTVGRFSPEAVAGAYLAHYRAALNARSGAT